MVRFVSDLYRYRHPLSPGDVGYNVAELCCASSVRLGFETAAVAKSRSCHSTSSLLLTRDGSVPVFVVVVRGSVETDENLQRRSVRQAVGSDRCA